MKLSVRNLVAVVVLSLSSFSLLHAEDAEDKKLNFTVQGDFVSSYVWRGMYQTGASFQPTLGLSVAGFSFTVWGSTDFDGNISTDGRSSKEIDLVAAYTIGNTGLAIGISDYWSPGQGANNYFNLKSSETSHVFEANLEYVLPIEKFPLSVAWNTNFAGADLDENGKRDFSSYVELNFPFSVRKVDLNATCGFVPYRAVAYDANRFAVTNVALTGSYPIKITDSFSLPIFAQAIWNPRMNDAHMVFGFSLCPNL